MNPSIRILAAVVTGLGLVSGCADDATSSDGSSGSGGSEGGPTTMTMTATMTVGDSADTSGSSSGADPDGTGSTAAEGESTASDTTAGTEAGTTGDDDDSSTGAGSGTAGSSGMGTASDTTGDEGTTGDGGTTGGSDTGAEETGETETGGESCVVGERVYLGDGCNFCDCTDAGLENCTARTCVPINPGCDYDGMSYAYAEHFPSTDGCNECVCAASGLACTRREKCKDGKEEGAILVESLDETCGGVEGFTAQFVFDTLEPAQRSGPFDYANDGPIYPETLDDTNMTVTVHYEDGFIVCRVPAPGQEAFDIEAIIEWQSEDGAFDEGQQTYIRRNARGFVDAITLIMTVAPGDIYGTYVHDCLDAGPISFGPNFEEDDSANGFAFKICETDIGLVLADWNAPAPD